MTTLDKPWEIIPLHLGRPGPGSTCVHLDSYSRLDRYESDNRTVVIDATGRVIAYEDAESKDTLRFTESSEGKTMNRELLTSADGGLFANVDQDSVEFFTADSSQRTFPVRGYTEISNGTLIKKPYHDERRQSTVFLPWEARRRSSFSACWGPQ
ncbi:hypothetical protein [Corynebacterium cystitidis]|uniref:hypothetical protein n=1 Tax=Corynebacterium cystitidis TaxID=35757 RepID=UPI00211EC0E0|nr:hypothetical protein [Corynebacterium cystitidis]